VTALRLAGHSEKYLVGAGCVAVAILAALVVLKPTRPIEAGESEGVIEAEPACPEAA
jgi:hypothetical protein